MNAGLGDVINMLNSPWPLSVGLGAAGQIGSWDAITAKGTDIASASTIVLTTATGPRIDITGTVAITAVTLANGSMRIARATGIFVLTASATLLVNKSASVNYTTAVGDLMIFTAEGGVTSVTVIGSSTSTVAYADQDRRNILLGWCQDAKQNAGYLRLLNTFADGFKGSDGVSSLTLAAVNTTSGYVGPTSGTPSTLVTWSSPTNIGTLTGNGGLAAAFDGTTSKNATASARIANSNPGWIGRFKSGDPKTVTRVKVYAANNQNINGGNSSGAAGTIKVYGKVTGQAASDTDGVLLYSAAFNDGTNSVGGNTIDITSGITSQASESVFVRIDFGANTTYDVILAQVEFYQGLGTTNNGTIVTTLQTADASVSSGRVLMEIDPVVAVTLNTDLTAEVTCDGGSHWTAATIATAIGKGQAGRTVIETADTATTAGTSFGARIKNLNNKMVNIYKLAMVVH